ncbi:MAG: ornithine--oxo-acid transaminase [Myxococcales bacterium]|nr:MAG: ornithine--oxo-acid transaminase [Myxococcales bacterium]
MMKTQQLIDLEKEYLAPNYKPLDVVLERGEGAWVYDVEGNKYLDFLSAYSALNQGYVHPRVLKTFVKQAKKCTLTSRAFRNDQLPHFAKELCELTGYEMMLPMNSGAEAVETALKSARLWGEKVKGVPKDRSHIIACRHNFHGRTIAIISFSTDEEYREGFGPFSPGFTVIPYDNANALERAITPDTVAFIVEPIQGEAGIVIPKAGYLKKVREICDRRNVLFIADEIQSGLGRTGRLFASDWEGVRADLVCLGKALSAGFYPVSAVVGSKAILSLYKPGQHGSTFGGNPLACAVAREALAVIREEKLVERSAKLGDYMAEKLAELKSPLVKEIRGRGLWFGIELKPEAGGARKYCEALMAEGLLCKETHIHTIRLAPPLVIEKKDINWALKKIFKVLRPKQ